MASTCTCTHMPVHPHVHLHMNHTHKGNFEMESMACPNVWEACTDDGFERFLYIVYATFFFRAVVRWLEGWFLGSTF